MAHTTESTPTPLYVAWTTSLLASAASFYFIEILKKPSAPLCWFERMLMFGSFLVLSVGLWDRDRQVWRYVAPFVVFGTPAALYQQLVHWDVIHVNATSCSVSGPIACTTKYFNLFGFMTQATLCLTAFVIIGVSMWRLARQTAGADSGAPEDGQDGRPEGGADRDLALR